MTLTQLYIFTVVLPNFHDFSTGPIWMLPLISLIIFCAIYAVSIAMTVDGDDALAEILKPIGARGIFCSLIVIVILSLGSILSPNEKQLYTVAGGYVATNTKDIAKLPDNIVKATNSWLEKAAMQVDTKPKSTKTN